MDPAIVLFGLCIGVLVGMTGMGGGSLMTPLLILIFGTSPTTAIGTDIVYSAITKMVGSWRHLKMGTVNLELVKWLSFGSVPAAVAGVALVSVLEDHISEDRLNSLVYAVLGGTLLMVGVVTLTRALILRASSNPGPRACSPGLPDRGLHSCAGRKSSDPGSMDRAALSVRLSGDRGGRGRCARLQHSAPQRLQAILPGIDHLYDGIRHFGALVLALHDPVRHHHR